MQATRFRGIWCLCENASCPPNTMVMDQLGCRSEVAVVSLVEVSAFADQSEILMLTLKRDVPEVGRQSHALRCTKVRQQKMESSLFSFARKVWPRMKIGKIGSAVLLVEVCNLQVPSLLCRCFAWRLGWKTELAEPKKGRIKTKKVFSPVDDVQSLLFHTILLARL
jgi:hypothetical protein